MRVAIVVERFEAGAGGIEDVAWQAAHGLAKAGTDVRVVCRQAGAGAQVPVAALGTTRAWQPLRVLRFDGAVRRHLRRERPDVVHGMSRTLGTDVFFAGGGSHVDYMRRQYGGVGRRLRRVSPRHAVLLALERRILADPRSLVHCNSALVARQLAERFGVADERLAVVPNGVDLDRYRAGAHAEAAARLRGELGQAGDGTVWLFAGSGFRRKGLDTALRALRAAEGDPRLWVLGRDVAGPWRRLAAELGVAERVHFLGYRRDPEVVYAAADGLLLPTRYDSFSTVCLEAAATGRPVVTSGSNGAGEVVRDAGAGVCVDDPEDAEGFAAALGRLADPEARRIAGARGRALAETRSWGAHVRALQALYARARERRRAA